MQITQDELKTAVHAALRNWTTQKNNPQSLLEKLLLVRLKREKIQGSSPTANRLATNQVLLESIEILRMQDEVGANLLSVRFLDGEKLQGIAYKQHMSLDQVKRRQREAIANLTQIIWEQETAVCAEKASDLNNQLLSASYGQLFGIDEQLNDLVYHITNRGEPWVIALIGIGGIGKTALADAIVRKVIEHFTFEQIIWLRIEKSGKSESPEAVWQHLMGQLAERCQLNLSSTASFSKKYVQIKHLLKAIPMLVVIDNLESDQDTAFIAEQLTDLTNPTKFLLTARTRLPSTSSVWTTFLKELTQSDSFQLIKSHARSIGLMELAHAEDAALKPLVEAVGGNPLALKLVVGLADVQSLPQILKSLISVNHQEIAAMYKHIYWQSWSMLSENGRILLEMMPMATSIGILPAQMKAISGLNEQDLWIAITELANRSLLEVQGTVWQRRYSIHRLTETFLQTEIIHWPEELM